MHNDLAPADTCASDTGVPVTIVLDARSFGSTRYDPCIDFVQAYAYHYLPPTGQTSDEQILKAQFALFNGQIESVHAAIYYAAGNQSLSVGDVIGIEDRYYCCDGGGWSCIALSSPLEPADAHRPPAPIPDRDGPRTPRCVPLGLDLPGVGAVAVLADATDQGQLDLGSFTRNLALERPDLVADLDIGSAFTHF